MRYPKSLNLNDALLWPKGREQWLNPPTPWSLKAKGKARGEAVHGPDTKVRHELTWSGEAYLALRS